jgi:hypothetical protein
MFADHAQAETEIPKQRFQPNGGFHVATGFAELEPVAQPAAREPFGLGWRRSLAPQVRRTLLEMKLEFVLEIGRRALRANCVGDARYPRHKRLLEIFMLLHAQRIRSH